MKTSKSFRAPTFNQHLLKFALGITAAFAAQSTFAGGITIAGNELLLTEYSSMNLTATYTAQTGSTGSFTVNPAGTDMWAITFSGSSVFIPDFAHDWVEPEDPTLMEINEVFKDSDFPNTLFVRSDLNIIQDNFGLGGISSNNTSFLIGTDYGIPIFLRFNDLAQSAESGQGVPETSSSFVLLALSAIALLGGNRIRPLRRNIRIA
jgi:hypothetical protein